MEDAPPENEPAIVWVVPSQMVASTSAETMANRLIVRTIKSVATPQGPPPSGSSVVIVRVTVPAVISAAEGV